VGADGIEGIGSCHTKLLAKEESLTVLVLFVLLCSAVARLPIALADFFPFQSLTRWVQQQACQGNLTADRSQNRCLQNDVITTFKTLSRQGA
jgi:hypothetical protein